MDIFSNILRILASWSEYWTAPRQQNSRDKRSVENTVSKNNKAIKEGNEDAINQELKKHYLPLIFLLTTSLYLTGCVIKQAVYIPQDHKAIRMEHSGISGWFVPDDVFAIILEKATRYDKLQTDKLNEGK